MADDTERRNAVIAEALTWLNTPYHHMGRIKDAGCDCATFLCEVYERAGVIGHIDLDYYPIDWHLHRDDERYLTQLLGYAHEITSPEPGDVAMYRYGRAAAHGAIYIDAETIIHSYIGRGVIKSNPASMADRLVGYYSLFGA